MDTKTSPSLFGTIRGAFQSVAESIAPGVTSTAAAIARGLARSAASTTSPSTNLNSILQSYTPTGALAETAAQDKLDPGVAASHQMADTDRQRLLQYREIFEAAGAKYDVPPALLAAIASRETRGGKLLDANGYGDHGNGFGLMQVDRRYHSLRGGPTSQQHVDQAASILRGYIDQAKERFPNWAPEQQMRAAVAAYNFGMKNVHTIERMDMGTTGDDYSNDVWARAQRLANDFGGTARGTTVQAPTQGTTQGLSAPPTSVLRQGDRSEQVRQLQASLRQAGINVTVDGIFGQETQRAVRDFQARNGLKVDGLAGPLTMGALNSASASGQPPAAWPAAPASNVASNIDDVPVFKQSDPVWGSRTLGTEKSSMATLGCAVTAVAMAISKISGQQITPGELDQYLDRNHGYKGNSIIWNTAAGARSLRAQFAPWGISTIDRELAAGRPVVVGVNYGSGNNGGRNGTDHWVTITGTRTENGRTVYTANDPANGQRFHFTADGSTLRASTVDGAWKDYNTTGELRTFSQR